MNRTELIEAVAARAGSDQAAARRHVDAVFDAIMENVAAGERVLVTGFGTFERLTRPARKARNPRTGVPMDVPAAEVPRFRVGQTFRHRVAGEPAAAPAAPAELDEADAPAPKAEKKPKKDKGKKSKKDAAAKGASASAKKPKAKAKAKGKGKKAGK